MKRVNPAKMTSEELVEHFVEIGIAQDDALLGRNVARYNRLFDRKTAVLTELKQRAGDHRRLLVSLYDHRNMQVRLNAAKATLAIVPVAARELLQAIYDSGWSPQAGDAGMALWTLEEGIYKPE